MPKPIKYSLYYALYLIVVWTAYRLSGVSIPQELDEFVVKPLVWLLPIWYLAKKEKLKFVNLGLTRKNLIPGVYLSIILGLVFALEAIVINYAKYGQLTISQNIGSGPLYLTLLVALATAFTEELAFRGYIFGRFLNYFKNEILSNLLVSTIWVVIHIPASFAVLGYNFTESFGFWFLAFLYSIGAGFIFARTRNIYASVILFVLWETAILLFR